jgi:hypothetical protein
MNIIGSFVSGIIASIIFWFIINKLLVPKLRIGEKISKCSTDENKSGFKYRFKFENYGCRKAYDIQVIVRLRIKGIKEKKNWEVVYIPTSTLTYNRVAIIKPVSKSGLRAILEIQPYECDYFQKPFFGEEINKKSSEKTLSLDDVMSLGSDAEFQIFLIATDGVSKSIKIIESKVYKKNDIVERKFDKNSINVKPKVA